MNTQGTGTAYNNPMATPDMEKVNEFSRREVHKYREIFRTQVHPYVFKRINAIDDRSYVRFGDTFASLLPEFTYIDSKQRARIDATSLYNVLAKIMITELPALDASYSNIARNSSNAEILDTNIREVSSTTLSMYELLVARIRSLRDSFNLLVNTVKNLRATVMELRATAGHYDPSTQSWVSVNTSVPSHPPPHSVLPFTKYAFNLSDIDKTFDDPEGQDI